MEFHLKSDWIIILDILYVFMVILVCLRIIYETDNTTKTLAYLLVVIFIPVGGIIFYFSFGINYRKRKIYSKKLIRNDALRQDLEQRIVSYSEANLRKYQSAIREGESLVNMLLEDSKTPLTIGNQVKVLFNGEEKYPELLEALRHATHHIHIQYYIYEDDVIGNKIRDILIQKANQGVKVRFIYDDFGSSSIRGKFVRTLREGGVEAFPFNRIRLLFLANRLNYRNHRKIVIVDGQTAFVGGINISDRYSNRKGSRNRYWRDTHLRIDGQGVFYLQYLFFCDWNFCSKQQLEPDLGYYSGTRHNHYNKKVQIAASGPDSPTSTIMLSILKAISLAKKEVLITTPYFIPGDSIMDAIKVASMSGVSVKILVPGHSDSKLVNEAARSYYGDLLKAGVQIYRYRKGFVHAKTIVVDGYISIVGTANMDYRSFDLNFEVNAVVYDDEIGTQLTEAFQDDISHSDEIQIRKWNKRSMHKKLAERIARLLSPLL